MRRRFVPIYVLFGGLAMVFTLLAIAGVGPTTPSPVYAFDEAGCAAWINGALLDDSTAAIGPDFVWAVNSETGVVLLDTGATKTSMGTPAFDVGQRIVDLDAALTNSSLLDNMGYFDVTDDGTTYMAYRNAMALGTTGGDTIIRVDPATGVVSSIPLTFTTSTAGYGDIYYADGYLYVSNVGDGLIYKLDSSTGNVLNTYDHGIDGRTAAGLSPVSDADIRTFTAVGTAPGRRVSAVYVDSDENKLYYGVIWQDQSGQIASDVFTNPSNAYTAYTAKGGQNGSDGEVWSVDLDGSGNPIAATAMLLFDQENTTGSQEDMPISDITLTADGTMVIGTAGYNFTGLLAQHAGDPFSLTQDGSGDYTVYSAYADVPGAEGTGGVDAYGTKAIIGGEYNIDNAKPYGFAIIAQEGPATAGTDIDHENPANTGFYDTFLLADTGANLKGTTGDVEYICMGVSTSTTDQGDLPSTFSTTLAAGGPSHTVGNTLYLGACVDTESNGLPDDQAGVDGSGGDDSNTGTETGTCATAGADEDGIELLTPLIPGGEACIAVTAVNSTGGTATLYGFIDYDGDGTFAGDSDELLNGSGSTGINFSSGTATVAASNITNETYCFDVPSGATFDGGETHLRFRLTTDTLTGDTWGGAASNGEVEDYYQPLVCVGNYVFADIGSNDGIQDGSDTGINSVGVDLVWGGADGTISTGGDNITYTTTTANINAVDGKYHFCGVTPGTYRVDIPNPPSAYPTATTLNQGGDDEVDSDGTQSGSYVTGPEFTVSDPNYAGATLFSLTETENGTGDDPGAVNNFPDSSDELTFDFGFTSATDWGDHPNSNAFRTTSGQNGVRHTIDGNYLGSCVDGEDDGQADTESGLDLVGGDDGNSGPESGTCATTGDDEDGVVFLTPFIPGRKAAFQVTTHTPDGNGCLTVFMTLNDSNNANAITPSSTSPTAASTTLSDYELSGSGTYTFHVDIPSNAANFMMRSRFRLTASCGQGGNNSQGSASSGEVEDYVYANVGNYVWEDTNIDGVQGDTDTSQNNSLTVALLDESGDPVLDADGSAITDTTNNSGAYEFIGLIPNTFYQIGFNIPSGYGFTPRDQSGDDTTDSDANVFTGRTIPFTVTAASEDTTWDAGFYAITNPSVGNRVWLDNGTGANENNGVLDSDEAGVPGVTVQLRQDTGDGIVDSSDTTVATVTTDSDGYYIFSNVTPGTNYFVCIDVSSTSYTHVSNSIADEADQVDTDENTAGTGSIGNDGIILGEDSLVCTTLFDVALGGEPTADIVDPIGYDDNDANMMMDFAFTVAPTAVTMAAVSTSSPISSSLLIAMLMLGLVFCSTAVIWSRRQPTES